MNIKTWMGLLTAASLSLQPIWAQAPPPPDAQVAEAPAPGKPDSAVAVAVNVSPATAEVVRLAESGLGDEVVSSYVNSSQAAFNLSADDIVYLKDVGIAEPVITLMMTHDRTLRESGPPANAPAPPPAVPAPEPAAVATPPNTPPPEYVSNPPPEVNYFYSDLAPYGTWLELEGVGWCWQPRCVVVNRSWQPYCDYGHWAYTDCGWYWSSSYSWGWAPFHYGRWEMHPRCGWVWTPDRVWGPAWVSWRVAGDRCGWAPLPPLAVFDIHSGWRYRGASVSVGFDFGLRSDHFTFVAFRDFGERDLGRHRLPRTEVTRIYNNTTIINNYTVNRNTVVNHGVSIDRVAAESHTRIQRATVRDVPGDRRPGNPAARGNSNVVYRRELPTAPRPAARVVAERVDANHPVVHHTPITPTKADNGPGRAGRSGQSYDANISRSQTTDGGNRGSSRDTPVNRRGIDQMPRTAPSTQTAPTARPGLSGRDTVTTPPNADRTPRQVPANRDTISNPRNAERPTGPVVTPPSVPSNRQGNVNRDYQAVPRSSRVYEDQPSRSVPSRSVQPESRGSSPQYYPKGSQQSSEIRSSPRSESRQSAPASSPPSRSSDDGRGSGRRDRDH